MDSGEWQELEVQWHPKQQPPGQQEQAQREAYEKGNRDDRPQRYRVRVSARKSGGDVVSALNRESLAIQRQKRYGTFTTRETVLPVALPSAL